jgi:RNA polymerase sigma factor (sigma-70 family)
MQDQEGDSGTSSSLLVRLQQDPADQIAWAEFVRRYGTRIHGWCRRWGLQEADAQEVTQEVLLKLTRAMQVFRYDPAQRFRGWLKTISHHAWQDLARRRKLIAPGGDPATDDPMQSLAARDDLAVWVEREYEQELMERALERVRPRVQPQTWDAFRLTAFDGLPGAEVAARLGIAVTSVYKAKSNVQKLLEAEVLALEGGGT